MNIADYSILSGFLALSQLVFTGVVGLYFWNLMRLQNNGKLFIARESRKEKEKLDKMRSFKLSEPLSSLTRPASFEEIIGQEEGIEALRAALCGPNPQHVIIYGPPGVGKTAAARLVLEEAKKNPLSPFHQSSAFVEVDATVARFDERGIADPLIGSVHDPIYQGAGPMGMAGIPQPKPGAVTKAHGGILFLDEIGELHAMQMNKLLKVLEDRKVMLESAYYSRENDQIPSHVHDIFQNGLPADFRLVGATTRMPFEIPAALRSRCLEIFFRPLSPAEIQAIARKAVEKIGAFIEDDTLEELALYAHNGREAVNIVQLAFGMAHLRGSRVITLDLIEKVVHARQCSPRLERRPRRRGAIGVVNALAVYGPNQGVVIEVEAVAIRVGSGQGRWLATGVIEEEELGTSHKTIRKKSTVKGAIENILTAIRFVCGLDIRDYDVHINFPGGIPVDGPSAGLAMAVAVLSAIYNCEIEQDLAFTGEVSARGVIRPVGGVMAKIEAARKSGVKKVIIPADNNLKIFKSLEDIEVIAVEDLGEVIEFLGMTNKLANWPKNPRCGLG